MKSTADPIVPKRRATSALLFENAFTAKIPAREQISPSEANANGMNCRTIWSPPSRFILSIDIEAARAMEAIIDPQYDSKISEPIPATSPTLSPTLSAITAGFRGSSSGIPASTLPTRSAPTSALFVKIPPPTRLNSATDEPPIAKPSMASTPCAVPPMK